jgi:predicted Zn-dependent peptidase
MLRWITLSAILFLTATAGQAQMQRIDFVEYELDNGLKVLLHEDETAPIVTVSVMYHVGSKNENPDRTGFAHFFEHLLFEGSENISRGEYTSYVQNVGGVLNANTSFDRTYYYEILPANQLELGLWLESERMLHAKVEQEGVDIQREVVKEERRQRVENQPYGSFLPEMFGHAFSQHPYRWPIIGSMAHLDAATEQDYINFYETFYVPNNAILSIAGDIDIEQTKEWIDKYFGTIPRGTAPVPRPEIEEPPLGAEVRDTVYDNNIQLPAVMQGYRIPAQGEDDYYALQMLSTLLSGGQSSRLYKALVDEKQQAVAAANFALPTEDPGLSIVYAIANVGVDPQDMEASMEEELERVRTELISEEEYQKLRNQTEADFISGYGSVASIAESLANYEMYFGDANLINTEVDRYLAVTREDIQRVAQKYLRPENRVVLYYLPKSAQPE